MNAPVQLLNGMRVVWPGENAPLARGFTQADWDAPSDAAQEPLKNDNLERLAKGLIDRYMGDHDRGEHDRCHHPWCHRCDLRWTAWELRDSQFRRRLNGEEWRAETASAIDSCLSRIRWHIIRNGGRIVAGGDDERPPDFAGRVLTGGAFILDAPTDVPAVWGGGDSVLWARGESLMIVGPPGVGKSTLAQQVVLARLGLTAAVLEQNVEATSSKVLYLACDRPTQIARSFSRMVKPVDRDVLDERLVVWKGPPPVDFAKQPKALLQLAQHYGADTVVVDSLKDVAIGLSEDAIGAGYNNARQLALAAGVEVLELHHQTKRGAGGVGKPTTLADVYGSAWITAGAGSVALIWGDAGDPVVQLSHLKQPAENVGPLDLLHDHVEGSTRIKNDTDPLQLLRAHAAGVTAALYARLLFVPDGTRQPKDNEIEKARRKLDGFVRKGLAVRTEPMFGGPAGTTPATYLAVA